MSSCKCEIRVSPPDDLAWFLLDQFAEFEQQPEEPMPEEPFNRMISDTCLTGSLRGKK